jgi:hypothetical protein
LYLTVEWDGDVLSWADMVTHIIGTSDPARAEASSIRGTLYASWADLNLPVQPSREANGIHFSHSAFEAMVERLLFCKGAILFTDALGAQLLARNISATTIQNWLVNPQLSERTLFEHMRGKNAAECIAAAVPLQGKRGALCIVYALLGTNWSELLPLQMHQAQSECSYKLC